MDAPTGEVILNIAIDAQGFLTIEFHLYDSSGHPAGESGEVSSYPAGVSIRSGDGELLLELPVERDANIRYRLYNRRGELLTSSDGLDTKIGPCLRMESWPRSGAGPSCRNPRPVPTTPA
ncbi:MAG: hypothetical protein ABR978_02590 [Dehalococcoidia bacterium]